MTLAHFGLIIVVIGTALLAYSVRIGNQYTLTSRSKDEKKYWEDIVARSEDGTYKEPTIVFIDKYLFYGGLVCAAIGSLMQW